MAGPGTPFANLAVAVGTTLSVVLLGYVLGSLGVCDPQASKGLRGRPFAAVWSPRPGTHQGKMHVSVSSCAVLCI